MFSLILPFARFIIPAVAILILLICIGSLFVNRPRVHTIAKLVDEEDGTIIDIDHWETSLGKSKANDITLDGESVARFHAVIAKKRRDWILTNTTSRASVLVNGKLVKKSCVIENEDMIQIGDKMLTFICDEAIKHEKKEEIRTEALENRGRVSGPVYAVLVNLRTKRPVYLTSESVLIGRGADCDISIPNDTISSHHARIEKTKNGWILIDEDSHNGTKLNGRYINYPLNIYDEDMITIGEEIFIFYEK